MEAEARYTWVGAGVLLLIVALVSAVLWLRNVGAAADFKHYAIFFESQSVEGLEIGADVSLRGLKIGRVQDYALDAERINRVRVEIRVDHRTPVLTNTVAVITRNFVTGIAKIALINRVPLGAPLIDAPAGERLPVVVEGRSDLDEIAGRMNKVGEIAASALDNLNRVLSPENREAISVTLQNLRALSVGLDQRLIAFDNTLDRIGGAADNFGRAARDLGGAGDRVVSVVEAGAGRFDRTLSETERTLAEARTALQAVSAASVGLQQQASVTAERMEDAVERADDQIGAVLSELRLSIEAATRVLDGLREPRAALLGPGEAQLGPGEAQP